MSHLYSVQDQTVCKRSPTNNFPQIEEENDAHNNERQMKFLTK